MIAAVTNPNLFPSLPASASLPFRRQQARPVLRTNEHGEEKAICTHVLSPAPCFRPLQIQQQKSMFWLSI